MVDILKESGALGVKAGTVAAPSSSLSAEEMSRPYSRLAAAVGGLGDTLNDVARPFLQTQARESVQRDAEGNITMGSRLEFTANDKAYNAAALQAGLAMGKTGVDEQMTKLRMQFDGKPEEFRAASREFIKTVGSGGDKQLRPLLQQEADRVAGQHYEGLLSSKHDLDLKRSLDALNSRESMLGDRLSSLAAQGGTATDEFQRVRTELDDIRGQKALNPKLNYTPERKAAEDLALDNKLKADAIIGIGRREYERTGDLATVQTRTERDLLALGMPPDEVSKHMGGLSRNLAGAQAARSERLNEATERAMGMQQLMQSGVDVDPAEIEKTRNELAAGRRWGAVRALEVSAGAAAGARAINGARSVSEMVGVLNAPVGRRGTTAADVAATYQGLADGNDADAATLKELFRKTGGAVIDPQYVPWCAAFADAILKQSGRPGRNSLRAADFLSYGTATDAPSRGDVVVFKSETPGISGHVGFVVGVEGSRVRYIAGNDSDKVQETTKPLSSVAGFRVPPPAGTPIEGVTVGAGSEQYRDRGDVVGYASTDLAGIAERRARQKAFDERATAVFSQMETTWKAGANPSTNEVAELAQIAPYIQDKSLRDRMRERITAEAMKQAAAGTPLPALVEAEAALRDIDSRGGMTPLQREELKATEKAVASQRKAVDEKPYRAATSFDFGADLNGVVKSASRPIDWNSQQGVAAAMDARARTGRLLENLQGVTARGLVQADESEAASAAIRGGGPGSTAFLQSLAAQRPEVIVATLENKEVTDSISALTRSGDAERMRSAFGALDAFRRKSPGEFNRLFGKDVEDNLEEWNWRISMYPADVVAREMSRADDPAVKKAKDILGDEAKKRLDREKLTPGKIAGMFDESILPFSSPGAPVGSINNVQMGSVLTADYSEEYTRAYKLTGDEAKSKQLATDRLKRVWGASALNGGTLMKFPPEKHYPTIEGGHDWLRQQLELDVRTSLGLEARDGGSWLQGSVSARRAEKAKLDAMKPEERAMRQRNEAIAQAPRVLVPDAKTEADIQAGRLPSYAVTVLRPDGVYDALTDGQNRPLRFVADPNAAMRDRRLDAVRQRGQRMQVNDGTIMNPNDQRMMTDEQAITAPGMQGFERPN
jgi:uncharacterized protein (TIGR02594 family)